MVLVVIVFKLIVLVFVLDVYVDNCFFVGMEVFNEIFLVGVFFFFGDGID